jgi:chromosome segregation ATPase
VSATKAIVVLLFAFLGVSCATTRQMDPQARNDRISAEHSQMKMSMPLLERENEVLKEENLQYRSKVRKLEDGAKQLSTDLTRLSQEFEQAMEHVQTQNQLLQDRLDQQTQANDEAVKMLTALNQSTTEQLSAAMRGFNEKLTAQKSAFNQQMESFKQENTKNQGALVMRIDGLEKSLAGDHVEIDGLKTRVKEYTVRLDAAGKEIEKIHQSRSELETALAGKEAEIEVLKTKINELSAGLDTAGKEIEKINLARKGMQKDLESLKSAGN